MDRGQFAEWALAPAMGPVRAEGVVGDLLEGEAARGPAWFWSNVLQALAGSVWGDVAARPLYFARLASRGALLLCASLFVIWRARILATEYVRASFPHTHFLVRHPKEWLWPAMQAVSLLATFGAGRWAARRSLGNDLAVCLAMALVFPFVDYGFTTAWVGFCSIGAHQPFLAPAFGRFWYHAGDLGFMAAFVLGMTTLRRRAAVRPA